MHQPMNGVEIRIMKEQQKDERKDIIAGGVQTNIGVQLRIRTEDAKRQKGNNAKDQYRTNRVHKITPVIGGFGKGSLQFSMLQAPSKQNIENQKSRKRSNQIPPSYALNYHPNELEVLHGNKDTANTFSFCQLPKKGSLKITPVPFSSPTASMKRAQPR